MQRLYYNSKFVQKSLLGIFDVGLFFVMMAAFLNLGQIYSEKKECANVK